MSGHIYIGSCLFEPKPFSRVEPVVVAEDGAWRRYRDWTVAFPPEGRVFAPHLVGFHQDELVMFQVAPNERIEGGRDHCVVSAPQRPVELLDYRDVDPEVARRALVEEGIARGATAERKVVVALRDGWCLPLRLERHPDGRRDVAVTHGLEELPVHTLDLRVFAGDRIRERLFTVPGATVGNQTGVVNWSLDSDFLKSILNRLRRAAGDGFPFSRAQIEQVVKVLARARIAPSNGEDLRAVTARLSALAQSLEDRVASFDELVDVVAELRPVSDGLSERRQTLEAELRAEIGPLIRRELEAEHAELVQSRDELIAEAAALAHAVEQARADAEAARADVAVVKAELGEQLLAAQGLLAGGAAKSLPRAEAAGEQLAARLSQQPEIWPKRAPPWARFNEGASEELAWGKFPERLKQAAEQFGFAFEDLAWADVAARSGRLVIVSDREAEAVVRCQAAVLTGGVFVRHLLDPAVISADDLWRRPGTDEPTPLAFAWTAARLDPRRYRIVLLDGLQRSPLDLWAPALIAALEAPERPENLVVFASYGARMLDPARGWADIAEVAVAIEPTPRARLNAELLAGAVGRTTPVSRFDAGQVDGPAEAELFEFLTEIPKRASAATARRALTAVRAAWPLLGVMDLTQVARALGAAEDLPEAIRRGAEMARISLGPSSN